MLLKRCLMSTALLAFCAIASAQPDLSGTWNIQRAENGHPPRGARTLPQTMVIQQGNGRMEIRAVDGGGNAVLYACAIGGSCTAGNDQRRSWSGQWDGAEFVLAVLLSGTTPTTLYRLYLSPDKKALLLRQQDNPQAIAFPYVK
ncbi:hypothetical protein [Hydrogenophaga sp.]|uniref:hypothetical protein n=1 Tax=Hydrogenophaga sp. TaxID=1904254 RepID=UPI003D141404